ncbi:shootin-1-like [Mixophyes fleayi]|uniref:shootin-1-like n=1 Tax=Mixophyes fleayi TaxID=3061075 RepID=UPI003F4DA962
MEESLTLIEERTMSDVEDDPGQITDPQISSDTDSSDSTSEDEDSTREDSELQGIAEISQKLLDELKMLEAKFDIEKTCRKQAEVYAAQVSEKNKRLSRFSMHVMPVLQELPQEIQSLVIEEQQNGDLNTDSADEYEQQIRDLQETIRKLVEEKKETTEELEDLKCQMKWFKEEFEDQRLKRKSLSLKLEKSERKFLKLNRVSLAVSRECKNMVNQLEAEQNLRHQAEIYAHKMLREQKAAYRQSMILMQNLEPSEMLMKALEDIGSLTTSLEETKQELQTKVKELEIQLSERPSQEEFLVIKQDLRTVNMEKQQLGEQLKAEQEKCAGLEEKVKSLEGDLKEKETICSTQDDTVVATSPPPLLLLPPPPPPPPPPMCLSSKIPEDPLALIKQRRGQRGSEGSIETVHADGRADAVREMMERIKSGVILRPARSGQLQSAVTKNRKSVICELQGMLMDTIRKPARKASRRRISRKVKDSELEFVLQRRRLVVDIPLQADGAAEKQKHSDEKDGTDPGGDMWCKEDSPAYVKRRQRSSNLQSSRRKQPELGQVLWQ